MSINVTVYCASSRKVDRKYFDATKALADELLSRNARVIYGGGAVGLMGCLADRYIEKGGAIVLIDIMSQLYLAGSEIDFVEDVIGSSFQIHNPNAKSECGCGTSFSV